MIIFFSIPVWIIALGFLLIPGFLGLGAESLNRMFPIIIAVTWGIIALICLFLKNDVDESGEPRYALMRGEKVPLTERLSLFTATFVGISFFLVVKKALTDCVDLFHGGNFLELLASLFMLIFVYLIVGLLLTCIAAVIAFLLGEALDFPVMNSPKMESWAKIEDNKTPPPPCSLIASLVHIAVAIAYYFFLNALYGMFPLG